MGTPLPGEMSYAQPVKPTPSAPQAIVVDATHPQLQVQRPVIVHELDDGTDRIAWILFIAGFCFPVCWWAGACVFCCSQSKRKGGAVACLVAATISLVLGVIFVIVWYAVLAKALEEAAAAMSTCDTCISNGYGWCERTYFASTCMRGTSVGPTGGSCFGPDDLWIASNDHCPFSPSPPSPPTPPMSCYTCVREANMGWCDSNTRCMEGG